MGLSLQKCFAQFVQDVKFIFSSSFILYHLFIEFHIASKRFKIIIVCTLSPDSDLWWDTDDMTIWHIGNILANSQVWVCNGFLHTCSWRLLLGGEVWRCTASGSSTTQQIRRHQPAASSPCSDQLFPVCSSPVCDHVCLGLLFRIIGPPRLCFRLCLEESSWAFPLFLVISLVKFSKWSDFQISCSVIWNVSLFMSEYQISDLI